MKINKLLAITLVLTTTLAPVTVATAAQPTAPVVQNDGNGNSDNTKPAYLRTLETALAALPADPSTIGLDGLTALQAQVTDVTTAIADCVNRGVKDKKIAETTNYDRLAPAQARVTYLQNLAAVEAEKAVLAIAYADGDDATQVTKNVTLPTTGVQGTTISWQSNSAALVADGTVNRPASGAGDANVTLTATIKSGDASEATTFPVTVKDLSPIDVQLLSLNDLHGKIDQSYDLDINGDGKIDGTYGRMDYVASYIRALEANNPKHTLLVHEGDATGGSSPVSSLNKEEPTVEILNALGFSGGTVGNHEFDKGVDELLRLKNGGQPSATPDYAGMQFPLVAANVVYKDSGETVLPPYFVKNVGGEKIGFIGVCTQSAAGIVMPAGIANIQFTDETAAVNKYAQELKAQGVHAIVVLAHMDATQDPKTGQITGQAADMAMNLDPDVDVILAAHNHKVVNGTVNGVLIEQSFEYGKAIGDINLTIDPTTHDIATKRADIVYTDHSKVQPDPQISSIINKYEDAIAPKLNEVLGHTPVAITGGYAATSDNALGNLIADSMRYEMKSDFAMVNGGGIRDTIRPGDVTWGELFNILPFNNILETLEIKGSDLYTILNAQVSKTYGSDFSVAGFRYTWDTATYKVTSITLPDGTPIDNNKTYTLCVNNFMATATSSKYLPMGKLGKNPVIGPEDLPAFVDYVKSIQGDLPTQPDGRIQVTTSNFTVTNKPGAADSLYIKNLYPNNVIRVYATADSTTPITTATVGAGQYYSYISGLDLGQAAGTVYVTISYDGKPTTTEGVRIPVSFQGE